MTIPELLNKKSKLVVGLMSGTSVDGVDAALVRINGCGVETNLKLLHFTSYPYADKARELILSVASAPQAPVDQLSQLNFYLGKIFARAAAALVRHAGFSLSDVDLIGSHGQTIRHLPRPQMLVDMPVASTWQIGEPSVIAKETGCITVADFRPADMAVGGQGAPLVPIFDFILYRSNAISRALLNIGGIANMTILPAACTVEQVLAFDTGPGNMLIDALCQKYFNKKYDRDGAIAGSGKVHHEMLEALLEDPYFRQKPPKSTGREYFGPEFLRRCQEMAQRFSLLPADLIATVTELTVRSIRKSYEDFVETPVQELIVSGGGRYNPMIMRGLQKVFRDVKVAPSDDYGIPADAKEAVAFAVLANETMHGHYGNVPGATGAARPTVLGKICL